MLEIVVAPYDAYDDSTEEFVETSGGLLQLEHSLISVSKWEASWNKPFLGDAPRTNEETLDYIRCMTMNRVSDRSVYLGLTNEQLLEIAEYINAPMTATTFNDRVSVVRPRRQEVITSEVIYYWMFSMNIPTACEKWHLNRLMTLIRVFSAKNAPPQKMSPRQLAEQNWRINEERMKKYNTSG